MANSSQIPCIDGSLVFQSLRGGGLVQVIEEATDSPITHVGIVRKRGEECVVIEAIGREVQETPLDQFLSRSLRHWHRSVEGRSLDQTQQFLRKAAKFLGVPYDFEFRHDNDAVYCSELVALAALQAGSDIFAGIDIPAHWLDLHDQSTRQYLSQLGFSGPRDSRLRDIRVITPRDLFYHNVLVGDQEPVVSPPDNAVYDTLPGESVDEKREYLRRMWGQFIREVQVEKDDRGGYQRYHFRLRVDGQQFSLTLFGRFAEEEKLARLILADLPAGTFRTPRSRLSEALTPAPRRSSSGCQITPLGERP